MSFNVEDLIVMMTWTCPCVVGLLWCTGAILPRCLSWWHLWLVGENPASTL